MNAVVVAVAGATVAGVVDARTGYIPNSLTATMMLASLLFAALDRTLVDGLSGSVAVGGSLLLLHAVSGGRGLGLGDVKLGTALGMALGLTMGLLAIGLAFVFGGIYAGWLLATKRAVLGTPIRFGPFIAAGTLALALVR